MKLTLLAVAHKLPDWVEAGFSEYAKRFPREWVFQRVLIKPEKREKGRTAEQIMRVEADRIREALPSGAVIVFLDERGARWTTRELATRLAAWQGEGQDVVFVIGGADGLDPSLKQTAAQLLQLSAMTLPHGMVQVLLTEQLYRAWSILANHPYHRE